MKLTSVTKVMVLRKIIKDGFNDPSVKYYSLLIMQDEDAGNINVPKEVYDVVKENEVASLVTVYNPSSKYDSSKFRVVGILTPTANNK